MFVNKLAFFITASRDLRFGTVEFLPNRQEQTVAGALKRVINIYERRGFKVAFVHADPEFEPLDKHLPHQQFNFCAGDEHVPDIERYIRTVKDRVRSAYNLLPFRYVPRLVVIRLVCKIFCQSKKLTEII